MLTYQNANENGYFIKLAAFGSIGLYNPHTKTVIWDDNTEEYIGSENTRFFKALRAEYLKMEKDLEPVNTFLEMAEENAQQAGMEESTMITEKIDDNTVQIVCNYESINTIYIYRFDTKEWMISKMYGDCQDQPITEEEAFSAASSLYYWN